MNYFLIQDIKNAHLKMKIEKSLKKCFVTTVYNTLMNKCLEYNECIINSKHLGRKDWIFMGTPGYGAPFHLDNVKYPSWQAQVCFLIRYQKYTYFSIL